MSVSFSLCADSNGRKRELIIMRKASPSLRFNKGCEPVKHLAKAK
jgi:hypothetical protein